MNNNSFPDIRLRRLRQNQSIRAMLGSGLPGPEKFIWPVFLLEGAGKKIAIDSMPGQFRYSLDELLRDLEPLAELGIGGVMLFGVIDDDKKSVRADYACDDNGIVPQAVREIRKHFPGLLIFTDVCVCGYTTHGHCGLITKQGEVMNDVSVELLAKMARSHARAGAHGVAPSAMMDGQVAAIRAMLREDHLDETIIMSYSTKFASAMYGPFRDAADSAPGQGDRRGYQTQSDNLNLALRESELDELEGADILMVKPALFYLDVIARLREQSKLPIAAYNVSGEYSMLIASAQKEWGDLGGMVREATTALCRAGTDIIISYWTNQYKWLFQNT